MIVAECAWFPGACAHEVAWLYEPGEGLSVRVSLESISRADAHAQRQALSGLDPALGWPRASVSASGALISLALRPGLSLSGLLQVSEDSALPESVLGGLLLLAARAIVLGRRAGIARTVGDLVIDLEGRVSVIPRLPLVQRAPVEHPWMPAISSVCGDREHAQILSAMAEAFGLWIRPSADLDELLMELACYEPPAPETLIGLTQGLFPEGARLLRELDEELELEASPATVKGYFTRLDQALPSWSSPQEEAPLVEGRSSSL